MILIREWRARRADREHNPVATNVDAGVVPELQRDRKARREHIGRCLAKRVDQACSRNILESLRNLCELLLSERPACRRKGFKCCFELPFENAECGKLSDALYDIVLQL